MSITDAETYSELKSIARKLLKRERNLDSMTATDLFHEAYFRLNGYLSDSNREVEDLKALFAQSMRRVIIDNARKRSRRNRKLSRIDLKLDEQPEQAYQSNMAGAEQLMMLEHALGKLAFDHPRQAKVVELKYFGGLTIPQCAKELGVSEPTVERDWAFAREWLVREVQRIADE
jgi:RNA polymerase sigma factor (TIGR02999 family)